jgi:hypothetical protein
LATLRDDFVAFAGILQSFKMFQIKILSPAKKIPTCFALTQLKKLQDQEVNKRLDDHYAEELLMKSMAQRELDQQKQLEKRKQNIELLKLQQDQVRENEIRLAKEKEDALKEEQKVAKELSKEDDNFKEFVTKEIEMFKLQGKPKRGFLLEKTLKEKE